MLWNGSTPTRPSVQSSLPEMKKRSLLVGPFESVHSHSRNPVSIVYYFHIGADIREMQNNTYSSNLKTDFINKWTNISRSPKPIIAAVNGYAVSDHFVCKVAQVIVIDNTCLSVHSWAEVTRSR